MARGVNKVILVGNLGRDPETRYAQNGTAVTRFSVATSESWRDRASGEQQERTEWHNVVCFARLGEIAGEYLRKGSKVYIRISQDVLRVMFVLPKLARPRSPARPRRPRRPPNDRASSGRLGGGGVP